jgi:hypothetical protein
LLPLQQQKTVKEYAKLGVLTENREWSGGLSNIGLPGLPLQLSGNQDVSFALECSDCRTFGKVVADINDDDGLNASLMFNGVGAYIDLGLTSSSQGTFSVSLGQFFGDGKNLTVRLLYNRGS